MEISFEVLKWLKENAYAEKDSEYWFLSDFPQDKIPRKLEVPMNRRNWEKIRRTGNNASDRVELPALTRIGDATIQAIIDKSNQEADQLANVTEGNFSQDDIKAILDNTFWLVAQAQLEHDQKTIAGDK